MNSLYIHHLISHPRSPSCIKPSLPSKTHSSPPLPVIHHSSMQQQKKMKLKQLYLQCFSLTLLFTTTLAQSSTSAPAPSGPTNITAVLEKAGQFSILIKLLKSTQAGDQINTQLNNSNQGLTIFAPPDNAFSNLQAGTLNSLTDQQKMELLQFHVLPTYVSLSQFQTVSNPLRTQAGNSNNGEFPLNVTTSGNNVNLTTGVVNATVANTIYSDGQLAVYQVDQVLLPLELFPPTAPAPSDSKKKKANPPSNAPSSSTDDASLDSSIAVRLTVFTHFTEVSFAVVVIVVVALSSK
ncbi:hypothetical protein NE237_005123 [Protea cynaroides]|uniref:FAS1 domain-containing protein n=1 Tax=Protea cynaroides TaxID=273540 RepID=A0A9Q0KKR8_9MAGN|nr:hypothetical protein NE237_005123 [Protea cynaroides]